MAVFFALSGVGGKKGEKKKGGGEGKKMIVPALFSCFFNFGAPTQEGEGGGRRGGEKEDRLPASLNSDAVAFSRYG